MNAYIEGQSILRVQFAGPNLRAEVHHKYIKDNAEGQKYEVFDGTAVDGITYTGKVMLSQWVERARKYARPKAGSPAISEKQGVAIIANRNPHVIDVEMALPGRVADRIDIVALERSGSAINIVFYEAKLFNNGALRARNFQPKVVEQLNRYEKWLMEDNQEEKITRAYRETCRLLIELRMMQGAATVHDLVVDASKVGSNLKVDPKPRLIVFGYNEDHADPYWKPHEEALSVRAGLGERRLIVEAKPENVRLSEDDGRYWIDESDDILQDIEGSEALVELNAARKRNRLYALAQFVDTFSDPQFRFATWYEPPGDKAGVHIMPSCMLSHEARAFVEAAFHWKWVISFAWSGWMDTPEARELNSDPDHISTASEEQLAKLLTTHIRSDRFSDGALQAVFERGILTAIVRRAAALLAEDRLEVGEK